jgi:hypothetical protein
VGEARPVEWTGGEVVGDQLVGGSYQRHLGRTLFDAFFVEVSPGADDWVGGELDAKGARGR